MFSKSNVTFMNTPNNILVQPGQIVPPWQLPLRNTLQHYLKKSFLPVTGGSVNVIFM